jgi:hypothetical protein
MENVHALLTRLRLCLTIQVNVFMEQRLCGARIPVKCPKIFRFFGQCLQNQSAILVWVLGSKNFFYCNGMKSIGTEATGWPTAPALDDR